MIVLENISKLIDVSEVSCFGELETAVNEISEAAKFLSEEEIASCYGININELNNAEKKFLTMVYSRGRLEGVKKAGEGLFRAMMDTKTATNASLSYLVRFGGDWEREQLESGDVMTFTVEKR